MFILVQSIYRFQTFRLLMPKNLLINCRRNSSENVGILITFEFDEHTRRCVHLKLKASLLESFRCLLSFLPLCRHSWRLMVHIFRCIWQGLTLRYHLEILKEKETRSILFEIYFHTHDQKWKRKKRASLRRQSDPKNMAEQMYRNWK